LNHVKVPSPLRFLCGSALAYWLSHIINPAFVGIAVMFVLFIPIILTEYYSDKIDQEIISQPANQVNRITYQPINNQTASKLAQLGKHSTSEFLTEDEELVQKAILTK
jgi:hypothetical protein